MAVARPKMNSESLQEAFPQVYKDLFSKCSIVTSAPGSFKWIGEYASNFGGIAISQKLPFRVYAGLEPSTEKSKIEFGTIMAYIPSDQTFKESELDEFSQKRLIRYLTETVERIGGRKDFVGFKIHGIYEVPKSSGLNRTSGFDSALMAAVLFHLKQFKVSDYQEGLKLKIPELIAKHEPFNTLFRESWKLASLSHGGVSSGASVFESLVKSRYPIVYFTEKRCSQFGTHRCESKVPYSVEGYFDKIDKIKYWAFDLGEFYNLEKMPMWPVDIGLIYSGSIKLSGRISRTIAAVEQSLTDLADFTNRNFKTFAKKDEAIPFFYEIIKNESGHGLWDRYLTTLSMVGLDVFRSFRDVFIQGSPEILRSFFKSINLYNEMIHLLDAGSPTNSYICDFLKEDTKKMSEEVGIAVKIAGAGRGGDIFFAAPYGSFRSYVFKTIAKLKNKIGKNLWLDYASWEDGYGEDGLLVEQFIDEDIFSQFISKGGVRVRHLSNKGVLHTDLYTLEEYEEGIKTWDLFLDPTHSVVAVCGKPLSSKEIHSARATIEILSILLDNLGKDVSNKVLPRSSYSTNRNELQSKIITPLQKILKKQLKVELDIAIYGGLHTFFVKLNPGNYHIHLLEKIF